MQLIENKELDPFLIAEISAIRKFSAHFRPVPSISNLRPQAAGRQESNRHTYEKLEPCVSHRKQTPGPISNRHKNALHPRYARLASLHPVATTVKTATRKLEFPLSGHSSTTSEFLIENFQRDLTLVECLSHFPSCGFLGVRRLDAALPQHAIHVPALARYAHAISRHGSPRCI